MAKDWIKLNLGLLDDERFMAMSHEVRSVWITAYLAIARDGGSVRDDARLAHLLRKQGIGDTDAAISGLRATGWLIPHTEGGLTLRGYEKYQSTWRGPSDDPEQKALRNARRPTTRVGRTGGASGGASGATVERQRRGERVDENLAPAREDAGAGERGGKSLKEIIGEFDEIVSPKRGTS